MNLEELCVAEKTFMAIRARVETSLIARRDVAKWIAYMQELANMGYEPAVQYMERIDASHYPEEKSVYSNYVRLTKGWNGASTKGKRKHYSEALTYLGTISV